MGWRHCFEKGCNYRVLADFNDRAAQGDSGNLRAGDILLFEKDYYSHYDGESVFQFRLVSTGEERFWCLRDDQSEVEVIQLFEKQLPSSGHPN